MEAEYYANVQGLAGKDIGNRGNGKGAGVQQKKDVLG